jgi:hypothetical protein
MPARCKVKDCRWDTQFLNPHIAGCLATWHVYEEHPDVWREVCGDRPPNDPDPRTKRGMAMAIIGAIDKALDAT